MWSKIRVEQGAGSASSSRLLFACAVWCVYRAMLGFGWMQLLDLSSRVCCKDELCPCRCEFMRHMPVSYFGLLLQHATCRLHGVAASR